MAVTKDSGLKVLLERGSALLSRGTAALGTGIISVLGAARPAEEMKRTLYNASYRSNIPLAKPRGISVEISTACNLRCRICHQWKDVKGKQGLTQGDLRNIIDDIAKNFPEVVLEFSGQEPTLNATLLLESMEYAKRRGVRTALSTNAMLIDRDLARRLVTAAPHHISVSLDSVTPEIHDYLRDCRGSHNKALSALRDLVDARKRLRTGTVIAITTVVCDKNLEELSQIHALAKMIGVESISYNAFVLDNSYFLAGGESYGSEFWIQNKRIKVLQKSIKGLLRLKKAGTRPTITNPEWQLREMPAYFREKEKFSAKRCLAGYNYFHIHKQGDVTVCGKGPFLNVKQYSLNDIWHSLAFYRTRKCIKRCEQPCINNCYVLQ